MLSGVTTHRNYFVSFLKKGSTLKGDNLGSKFSPLRVDPFSEGLPLE